jgi:hypothetical protein
MADTTSSGNANHTVLTSCFAWLNKSDGFHFEHNNSNVCTLTNCQTLANGGWGFFNYGTGDNQFIGCAVNADTTGGYYEQSTGAVYLMPYAEGSATMTIDTTTDYMFMTLPHFGLPALTNNSTGTHNVIMNQGIGAFVSGDHYLTVASNGTVHRSSLGPAS